VESDAANDRQHVSVPIKFLGEDEALVAYANLFSIQNPGRGTEFILTAAQIVPPILLGTPEEQREQMEERGYVAARVLARLALTPDQLRSLGRLINETVEKLDRVAVPPKQESDD
jgi:hypothetical protein